MRFLTITGSGINSVTGSVTIGISVSGSLSRLGVIGTGIPSVCPASMLQASNGTLLVATGLGQMLRMRRNERRLSPAGVPAPTTAIKLLSIEDYVDETPGIPDPLGTGKFIELVTFDFSQYGSVRGDSSFSAYGDYLSPQGRLSLTARGALLSSYWSRIAAISSSELASNGLPNQYARNRVADQLTGYTLTSSSGRYTQEWNNVTGSFYVYANQDTVLEGDYQCFQRWVDADGYVSDPGPLSSVVSISDRSVVKYDDVVAPSDARVVKRQIWRNDAGQLQNFYLDIETDDLTSTEFTSSKTDAQLVLSDVITFTDVDGYTIPYLYGQPPDDKPFIAELRGRIFAIGSRRYTTGSAQVSNGSETVYGIGTEWSGSFIGRRFICGNREYLIQSVNESSQTITLSTTYQGSSDNFALYTIAPYAAEELVVRWSDPTAGPESWPITAQLLLPQDGDVITGLVNYGDALYITKTRNTYRLNFSEDPAIDGSVVPAAKRGCINSRCAVSVEGACYMLDREGIHGFTGGPNPQHISIPIADIFREATDGYRINWNADLCFWHAILHQEISTIKWYVAMAGDMYPQHAICYDYRKSRFWVEEYPRPISASCASLAITGRPLLGSSEGRILVADTGSLDLIEPGGTLLTISEVNSPWSVTLTATPKTCEGVPAVVVTGPAAGEDRIVTWQGGTEIQFGTPFSILPRKGDKIQLGGVRYRVRTAAFDSERMDGDQPISLAIKVNPDADAELYGQLTIYKNGFSKVPASVSAAPATWGAASHNPNISATNIQMQMASSLGIIVANLSKQTESDTPENFEWQFGIDGCSGDTKPKINEIKVTGAG